LFVEPRFAFFHCGFAVFERGGALFHYRFASIERSRVVV